MIMKLQVTVNQDSKIGVGLHDLDQGLVDVVDGGRKECDLL